MTTEAFQPTDEGEQKREKREIYVTGVLFRKPCVVEKVRRAYVLGGCLITMWLSTHAILLWK